jgi:hypothetical protein
MTGVMVMMLHSNNGGPAFPAQVDNNTDEEVEGFLDEVVMPGARHQYSGMTLRDYFAAKAVQGMLACSNQPQSGADMFARDAYSIADAMLAERAK